MQLTNHYYDIISLVAVKLEEIIIYSAIPEHSAYYPHEIYRLFLCRLHRTKNIEYHLRLCTELQT